MAKYHLFYNPISGNNKGKEKTEEIRKWYAETTVFHDVLEINLQETIDSLSEDDIIVVAGGDGTLNHFVNDIDCETIKNEIYYYPAGTGNDFYRDVAQELENRPVRVDEYLKKLPTVTVNGKTSKFFNGIGFGIDGYCCEVGDKLREESDKPVNYTSIAIKGLLFKYKPTAAKITVDGKVYEYKKVWLAPTMFGQYYGGGMIPAEKQTRKNGKLSVMVLHDSGKIRTLMAFPSIFEGKIGNYKKIVDVIEGNDIKVEFDVPRSLQIDGETVLNVKEYTASL